MKVYVIRTKLVKNKVVVLLSFDNLNGIFLMFEMIIFIILYWIL